jgi:SAM-dependent methyltransferase
MTAPPQDPDLLVAALYRGLLGREPDPDGLRHHANSLAAGTDLADVLRRFVDSPEFAARFHGPAIDRTERVDLDPPLPIALAPPPETLARLWAHIGATWATLGETDPYWSVLSDPRFHLPNMSDAAVLDFFYASGQDDLARLDAWLRRNQRSLTNGMTVAEYGCGVGRLTAAVAARCARVLAFDISPTHLDRATAWLDRAGHHNVTPHLVRRPEDLDALTDIDLFVSNIVLQHNPPPVIALILERAFAGLNHGGLAFFQVPTYKDGYSFDAERYLAGLDGRTEIEMHVLPQNHIFRLAARHRVVPLEIEQDNLTAGWGTSHTFLFQKEM